VIKFLEEEGAVLGALVAYFDPIYYGLYYELLIEIPALQYQY
jgi:hypothetical protein